MSTGGTTNRNRNSLLNSLLRFFYSLLGNILATNQPFLKPKNFSIFLMTDGGVVFVEWFFP